MVPQVLRISGVDRRRHEHQRNHNLFIEQMTAKILRLLSPKYNSFCSTTTSTPRRIRAVDVEKRLPDREQRSRVLMNSTNDSMFHIRSSSFPFLNVSKAVRNTLLRTGNCFPYEPQRSVFPT